MHVLRVIELLAAYKSLKVALKFTPSLIEIYQHFTKKMFAMIETLLLIDIET